jgi:hypothetical protein
MPQVRHAGSPSGLGVAAEGESLSSHWIEVEEPMDEWVEIGAFAVRLPDSATEPLFIDNA